MNLEIIGASCLAPRSEEDLRVAGEGVRDTRQKVAGTLDVESDVGSFRRIYNNSTQSPKFILTSMLSISVRISTIPGKILHHSLQPLFGKAFRQKIACIMYAHFAFDQHMCTHARTRSCTAGAGARKHQNYLDCCRGRAFRCVSDFPVQVEVIGSYACVCVRVSARVREYVHA